MIQKITHGNFWTVNLIMRAKIVNQSSNFPVRRTGSYRHKKALDIHLFCTTLYLLAISGIGRLFEYSIRYQTEYSGRAVKSLFAQP